MKESSLEETLDRYRAFWKRQETDRPIIGVCLASYFPLEMFDSISLPEEGYLRPEDLDVGIFLDEYEREWIESREVAGDQFWVATPFWGIPWMEAIVGCPIRISGESIWAEPFVEDLRSLQDIALSGENAWLQKLLEFTKRLVERSKGRYPVSTPIMRGPSDIVAAMRGSERFMLDLYDHPDEVRRLAEICADIWIRVAGAQLNLIPPFHGGYCSGNRQIWAPGICIETQEDASRMISPNLYRRFFLSSDRRIVSSFDFAFIHLHSNSLHILDELLGIPQLAAIEITIDVTGPSPMELIPVIGKVQKQKPVIVHGKISLGEMKEMVHSLSSAGLCLISRVDSADDGNRILEALMATFSRHI